jgi:hypothetical protein
MAIGRVGQPTIPGASIRLEENQGRMPFKQVDTNGKGAISKQELTNAVRLNFPTLTDLEASAIATKAFDAGSKNGKSVTSSGWKKAEQVVLREAAISITDKQRLSETPGAWGTRPMQPQQPQQPAMPADYRMTPPPIDESNMYQPQPDYGINNQPPYQAPPAIPESKAFKTGAAVGRGLTGFLKMLPVVGNLINAYDFVKDIGKGVSTWLNPNKTFGEKLKAGADLLFHGAGMIAPQIGGAYDIAQSAARLASIAGSPKNPAADLPPWQMDNGGYPPRYPMEYGNRPPVQQPAPPPQYDYPQQNPYATNPPYIPSESWAQPPAPQGDVDTKKAVGGMARMGVGALKMVPLLGNLLNGLDLLRDMGRVVKNVVTLHPLKALKAGADMLFHGAGVIVPQVGGAYDMAQGLVRLGRSMPPVPEFAQPAYQQNPWATLPPYTPNYENYPQLSAAY